MVMQNESVELLTSFLSDKTNNVITVEYGESVGVDFSDDSLDTVHETIIEVFPNVSGNKITYDSTLTAGLAVGDTINSELLKINGKAVNKNKYLDISKDNAKIIDSRETIYILVD